jgi:hypothetical protein
MRGATSVSSIKGRARLKRYLAPSASVQEDATEIQGTSRCDGRRPVTKYAAAATKPQSAPAVPATVKARSTVVSSGHFRRKTALKSARSKPQILRARFFKFGSPGIVPLVRPGVRRVASRGSCSHPVARCRIVPPPDK